MDWQPDGRVSARCGERNPLSARVFEAKGDVRMSEAPLVGIIMGSKSDMEAMEPCSKTLEEFGIEYELVIASAHRAPEKVAKWSREAAGRGMKVLIGAAGKAAALPGVVASHTVLPVIGVPMKTSDLGGMDSLLSIVQMPKGVPVATVAINGAQNAALLAIQIIATGDEAVAAKFAEFKERQAQ